MLLETTAGQGTTIGHGGDPRSVDEQVIGTTLAKESADAGSPVAGRPVEELTAMLADGPGYERRLDMMLRLGAYGEYMAVPGSGPVIEKPSNMTFEEAAAVPLGGLNAIYFLKKVKIHNGQKVLINGAGGSIGTYAVQID